MSKVILSFDDSRLDTYTVAYPMLKKYGLVATINAISQFVINRKYDCGTWKGSMTIEQIIECQKNGFEIASHGSMHDNDVESIKRSISDLKKGGVDVAKIGFASPYSMLTVKDREFLSLIDDGTLAYIRSGIQIKREGLLYAIASFIERRSHSKWLFWLLNKKNIIKTNFKNSEDSKDFFLSSVAITKWTTLRQIKFLLSKIKEKDSVILMFHSILPDSDSSTAEGAWRWSESRFQELCLYLKNNTYDVCTTLQLVLPDSREGKS